MSSHLLLDTDIFIDVLEASAPLLEFIGDQLRPERYAISLMTYGEAYEGSVWSRAPVRARARFETFLVDAEIDVLPFTLETMRLYAQISGSLRKAGNWIGVSDILIAATALEHDLDLVTRNVKHFDRIAGLKLITPTT